MKEPAQTAPRQALTVFDSTCIIVGIIIGVGIYETAPLIAASMASGAGTLLIWLAGGLLALSGAVCYAELASAYPREGGDYVYLSRAYGPWAGYMFGWSQLAIVRPGDIALMAFVFGRYASKLIALPFGESLDLSFGGLSLTITSLQVYAGAAVVVFTLINIVGVSPGKWTQNVLTVIKAAGILAIVAGGLFSPASVQPASGGQGSSLTAGGFKLALILVLFTYGGWNEMAYVAAEIKNPRKNIVRALVVGTASVIVLYLLINGAFLRALGYEKMVSSEAVAVDAMASALPSTAGRIIGTLICLSALGAVNGLILTGARVSYALGAGHRAFRLLGVWHSGRSTPVRALLAQGILSLIIIIVAERFVETILYNAPVYWLFTLATALAVFVLRRKDSNIERPYRITGHPFTTVIFALCCVFMIYSCITYAWAVKPRALALSGGVLAVGALLYLLNPASPQRQGVENSEENL